MNPPNRETLADFVAASQLGARQPPSPDQTHAAGLVAAQYALRHDDPAAVLAELLAALGVLPATQADPDA